MEFAILKLLKITFTKGNLFYLELLEILKHFNLTYVFLSFIFE